jgi:hypothetical protein
MSCVTCCDFVCHMSWCHVSHVVMSCVTCHGVVNTGADHLIVIITHLLHCSVNWHMITCHDVMCHMSWCHVSHFVMSWTRGLIIWLWSSPTCYTALLTDTWSHVVMSCVTCRDVVNTGADHLIVIITHLLHCSVNWHMITCCDVVCHMSWCHVSHVVMLWTRGLIIWLWSSPTCFVPSNMISIPWSSMARRLTSAAGTSFGPT